MPDREFLETYPLYRKFQMEIPGFLGDLRSAKVAIHMRCATCSSDQTFNMANEYYEVYSLDTPARGKVIRLVYKCTSCGVSFRYFLIKFDPEGTYVMKVGQEPPWDITPDPILEKALGQRADFYKKALVCESQSYGIGAFAYYRRIVEEIIDELLDGIADLMTGEEREKYLKALEQTKKTTVTQDKIDLVKDLLPPILRPDGMNPLSVLHSTLSQGLHQESDELCMALAAEVREILVFLVNQITVTRSSAASFTDSMRKLLNRRTPKS